MVKIYEVHSFKYLGVYIDSSLSWKNHVQYTKKKVAKSIGILSKARKYLDKKHLLNLYYAFTYPYLSYGIQIWGGTYESTLLPLYRLQKIAIRKINNLAYKLSTKPFFKNLKILKLHQIYKYSVGIFIYKVRNHLCPSMFDNFFQTNDLIHSHFTRQRTNLHSNTCNTNFIKHNIKNTGVRIWNSFPSYIKTVNKIDNFKRKLKAYIITEVLD